MSALIPFRPWKFADGDTSPISILIEPERKSDDRSPFVRYARSAALWAEWVRDGVVTQEPEPSHPVICAHGYEFRLSVAPLDSLHPLMSVPPSAKEHRQRLLEGVQLYPDPIVVVARQDGSYTVVANHELFQAAKAYQIEMARPGKVRSSDYCLVAVTDVSYLETLTSQPLTFTSHKSERDIQRDLLDSGYALSPRADDPSKFKVLLGDLTFSKPIESGDHWKHRLAEAFGVKTLDMGSKAATPVSGNSGKKIVLMSPKVARDVQEIGTEYPYGSIATQIVPPTGAMMWNLRDF